MMKNISPDSDKFLVKFMSIEWATRFVKDCCFYCSDVRNFSDTGEFCIEPSNCVDKKGELRKFFKSNAFVDFLKSLDSSISKKQCKLLSKEAWDDDFDNLIGTICEKTKKNLTDNFLVTSFTTEQNLFNPFMWKQYAGSFLGIAFKFVNDRSFFSTQQKIIYSDSGIQFSLISLIQDLLLIQNDNEQYGAALKKLCTSVMFRKNKSFSIEQEVRLISDSPKREHKHFIKLKQGILKEIYVSSMLFENKTDEFSQFITCFLSNPIFDEVKIFKVIFSNNSFERINEVSRNDLKKGNNSEWEH